MTRRLGNMRKEKKNDSAYLGAVRTEEKAFKKKLSPSSTQAYAGNLLFKIQYSILTRFDVDIVEDVCLQLRRHPAENVETDIVDYIRRHGFHGICHTAVVVCISQRALLTRTSHHTHPYLGNIIARKSRYLPERRWERGNSPTHHRHSGRVRWSHALCNILEKHPQRARNL